MRGVRLRNAANFLPVEKKKPATKIIIRPGRCTVNNDKTSRWYDFCDTTAVHVEWRSSRLRPPGSPKRQWHFFFFKNSITSLKFTHRPGVSEYPVKYCEYSFGRYTCREPFKIARRSRFKRVQSSFVKFGHKTEWKKIIMDLIRPCVCVLKKSPGPPASRRTVFKRIARAVR